MVIDMTRHKTIAQKKSSSALAFVIDDELVKEAGVTLGPGKHVFKLAVMPANSMNKYLYRASTIKSIGATKARADIGTAPDSDNIIMVDLLYDYTRVTPIPQDLGSKPVPIYMTLTIEGTATTLGRHLIIIDYIEYEKNTGEYTNFA